MQYQFDLQQKGIRDFITSKITSLKMLYLICTHKFVTYMYFTRLWSERSCKFAIVNLI